MDIPAKVREDIDDPLAQELVIDVCLLLIDVINLKSVMALTRCLFSFSSCLSSMQTNV